ncbi:MAG: metal ABC transporter ATP-binding protein [Firmicutes bacterium]|nr:metal ABC transporter ATP-binding protein [Bacillota bacterium]MCM1401536.1 metal ABC transporter ATP-binding protein [Bacteroides sp.]MCM1476582.1 metal ABC transporter ATP-binding protein [Bacteroides sp.]
MTPVIELSDINFKREGRTILSNVNFTINHGDFIAITGPNGGGKTTLMRIILRLLAPDSGKVVYCDEQGLPVDNLHIGYLPQKNMIDSRFPITVSEMVELGLPLHANLSRTERKELVRDVIGRVGLESHASANIGKLSGGQLQRAMMARAVISNPSVLVLDEPLSYVDRQFEQRIYSIVESFKGRATILLVSHDMTTIASMATRHVIVNRELEFCHSHSHFVRYDCAGH